MLVSNDKKTWRKPNPQLRQSFDPSFLKSETVLIHDSEQKRKKAGFPAFFRYFLKFSFVSSERYRSRSTFLR